MSADTCDDCGKVKRAHVRGDMPGCPVLCDECIDARRPWFRDSHGAITDGNGWEIHRDAPDSDDYDPAEPWSLWHHGEYVANYSTTTDAKADAIPAGCSKCAHLTTEGQRP